MSFEQMLRAKIAKAPFKSTEKEVLKVVLGEWQLKAATGKVTDELGFGLVKKMIKANDENLLYLGLTDPRRAKYNEENRFLNDLLPEYLTVEQVLATLAEVDV